MSKAAMRSACEFIAGVDAPLDIAVPGGPAVRSSPILVAGLIVDVADVLYDATLWRRWLWRLVARLGLHTTYESFYDSWDRKYLADVNCGRREFAEAFQAFLSDSGLSWAQIDEIEAASRTRRHNLESNVRPLPGVVKTMTQLAEWGLPVVAWSDAPFTAAKLIERLDRLGLVNRFRAAITSFDSEVMQQAPRCYHWALDALGLAAYEVAYIGHDTEHLAGAKAFGLRTVAFNFQRPCVADHYLVQFQDLLSLIQVWGVARPANRPRPVPPLSDTTPSMFVPQGNCR